MNTIQMYIGFEQQPRADWQSWVPPPTKPSNWGDEAWERRKPELMAKQAATAARHLAGGVVSAMTALVTGNGQVMTAYSGDAATVLSKLAVLPLPRLDSGAHRVYGFDVMQRLRHAGWTAATAGNTPLPPWIWDHELAVLCGVRLVNLYSVSGAKHDSNLSVDAMRTFWLGATGYTRATALLQSVGIKSVEAAHIEAASVRLIAEAMGMSRI